MLSNYTSVLFGAMFVKPFLDTAIRNIRNFVFVWNKIRNLFRLVNDNEVNRLFETATNFLEAIFDQVLASSSKERNSKPDLRSPLVWLAFLSCFWTHILSFTRSLFSVYVLSYTFSNYRLAMVSTFVRLLLSYLLPSATEW